MKHTYHLKYSSPANAWGEAMPLGNGRLGAMVYGQTGIERIQLNDDSLWYGKLMDRNNPLLKDKLKEIRELVLSGDAYHAEELILQYMAGTPGCMRHYSMLGEIDIALNQHLPFAIGWIPNSKDAEEYVSDLDLMTGVLDINHTQNGVKYHRQMFISYPAQVMCLRMISKTNGAVNLDIVMNRISISDGISEDDRRPGKKVNNAGWPASNVDSIRTIDNKTILMHGHEEEIEFATAVRVVCDGRLIDPVSQLLTRDCTEVVLYAASSTSNRSDNCVEDVLTRLDLAEQKGFEPLKEEHVKDFYSLMNRCVLDLGTSSEEMTDKRLDEYRKGKADPALAALYYQFGRYLIVSGGRENSSALNLQGIWNSEFMPMWDSKYTININLQMNYWPVETGNLTELHMPLMKLLQKMHPNGCKTAGVMYGMRGMVCHHNTDFYGDCAPQDWYMAAMPWVTGGAWLGLHIWEHYTYTLDQDFLRSMYPVMKDLALFYEDFLIELDGKLITCPSVSPENRYLMRDGYDTPICAAPAMDNQILREFFDVCSKTQQLLGVDEELSAKLREMAKKLPEDKIGSKGQLLEWDKEYKELTPGMGHVSHLFGCYPGSTINWRDTPELIAAVRKSLNLRIQNGAGRGGWPLAWYISIYARLLDCRETDKCIKKMIADSTSRNLLNARMMFQIDGNLGAAAGIAECLLQSHIAVHFLPALPYSWNNGQVRGLCARGGHEIDISWNNSKLTQAVIRPKFSGSIEVVGDIMRVLCEGAAIAVRKTDIGFSFLAEANKTYRLTPYIQ